MTRRVAPRGLVDSPAGSLAGLADSLALGGGALAVYLALLQDQLVNPDALAFVNNVALGSDPTAMHPLYGPAVQAALAVLQPLGLPLFRAMGAVSALGAAAGVFCFHRALRRIDSSRLRCAAAGALCAATPAVMFFGTVIEAQGLLLAGIGLAWWLAARYAARPAWWRAVPVACATGVSGLLHATGHFQLAVLLAWLWTWPWSQGRPPRWHLLLLLPAVHAAASVGAQHALAGEGAAGGHAFAQFFGFARDRGHWHLLANTAWLEWIVPFFPASLLGFLAFRRRELRAAAGMFAAAVAAHVAVSYIIIPGLWERGTYMVGLAYFAALLSAQATSLRTLAVAVALAFGAGTAMVAAHDRTPPARLDVAGALALAAEHGQALVIVETLADATPLVRAAPGLPILTAHQLIGRHHQAPQLRAEFDHIHAHLTRAGRAVLLAEPARRALEQQLPDLAAHLAAAYELVPCRSGSFVAYRVRRR